MSGHQSISNNRRKLQQPSTSVVGDCHKSISTSVASWLRRRYWWAASRSFRTTTAQRTGVERFDVTYCAPSTSRRTVHRSSDAVRAISGSRYYTDRFDSYAERWHYFLLRHGQSSSDASSSALHANHNFCEWPIFWLTRPTMHELHSIGRSHSTSLRARCTWTDESSDQCDRCFNDLRQFGNGPTIVAFIQQRSTFDPFRRISSARSSDAVSNERYVQRSDRSIGQSMFPRRRYSRQRKRTLDCAANVVLTLSQFDRQSLGTNQLELAWRCIVRRNASNCRCVNSTFHVQRTVACHLRSRYHDSIWTVAVASRILSGS